MKGHDLSVGVFIGDIGLRAHHMHTKLVKVTTTLSVDGVRPRAPDIPRGL